jgi:hypothetical protein
MRSLLSLPCSESLILGDWNCSSVELTSGSADRWRYPALTFVMRGASDLFTSCKTTQDRIGHHARSNNTTRFPRLNTNPKFKKNRPVTLPLSQRS